MRIADLLSISEVSRAISLSEVGALRESIDREGESRSLQTGATLQELLTDYVAQPDDEADVALRAILGHVAEGRGQGAGILVQGPAGAGKSHLLLATALLLEYPELWPDFITTHPAYESLRASLVVQRRKLVVPLPLAEHRGHNEHLEDILFDRTERELARSKYGIEAPLSEQTYALGLIERHIVPRYAEELDARARQQGSDCANWMQLRDRDQQAAIAVARHLATEQRYPLDFRQSRVERVSWLLEVLRDHDFGAVVWIVDDLTTFLSSVDAKAIRGDCGFFEFLGQRAKISPFFVIAAVEEAFDEMAGDTQYLLQGIRAAYDVTLSLSATQVREVVFQRVVHRTADERSTEALANIYAQYQQAFGQCSFTEQELSESYPLHPTAARCLQSICARFLDKADGLLEFVNDSERGLSTQMERDARLLTTPAEALEYLRPQLASHPQVAPYFNQALDYYLQNAAQLIPEDPEAAVEIVRTLVALRLANITAPADLIAECLGLREDGSARLEPEVARRMLENMRLIGRYVDVRRGAAPDSGVYLIDVQTSLSELVRQRLNAVKGTLADDDDRLWRRVLAACDSPTFPLAELTHGEPLEITWQNSARYVAVELVNLATVTLAQLGGYASELGDPTVPEACHLFIARLLGAEHQAEHWAQLCQSLPASRWRAGLLAWVPRALTPQELDIIKQSAACHELLRQPGPNGEVQAAWRGRLLEERLTLDNQVRQIVHAAYYEGQVLSADGVEMEGEDILALKGDWLPTMAAIADVALAKLFPDFPRLAPRRPLDSRQQLNALIDGLIRPRVVDHDPDAPLTELADSFLGPLGLTKVDEGRIWLDAASSPAAREILDRLRQRDQTPEHERGRALSCADLAQHMVKSSLGLPPELFELLIAVLVRLGYLVALDGERNPLRFEDILSPFAAHVAYVARAPLLTASQWQVLSRLARVTLEVGIPGPDTSIQHYIWERLLELREQQLERLDRLEQRLTDLQAALGQEPRQWANATRDLNDARQFYQMFDPQLHSSVGLPAVMDKLEPYMREGRGATLLSALLRRINELEAFLTEVGPDVVAMQRYLSSSNLALRPGGDLDMRRQALLELISSAEELVDDELNFRRQLQIFLTGYKRRYISWHSRSHHATVFEKYKSVRATPEFRALQQLQGLDIEARHDAAHVGETLEHYLSLRCTRQDLAVALDEAPVCSSCHLKLDEELRLPPPEELYQAIAAGLGEYAQALRDPAFAEKLRMYAEALPHKGDVSARLLAVLELPDQPTARDILTVMTDDVIAHINRVLAGKTLIPRDFGELREALQGRTLTKSEAQKLLARWLEGADEHLDDDEILHIQ